MPVGAALFHVRGNNVAMQSEANTMRHPKASPVGTSWAFTEHCTLDDGLVLIEGKLWKPEDVTKAAAQAFERFDGNKAASMIKRYARCYPQPDATTPSFRQFKGRSKREAVGGDA